MNADEFRSQPELVSEWKKVLESPLAKMVFEIMEIDNPIHKLPDTTNEVGALTEYGYEKGYAAYQKQIFDLARLLTLQRQLTPTYGVKANAKHGG